ncbi:MAG TPA: fumarylacetoacetate hydrolase family protein [Clostridia bacterium]|nr:fumarylacetoacetate hydrolase family protein [Clostridia bacterium]
MKIARVQAKDETFYCIFDQGVAIRLAHDPYSCIEADGRRYGLDSIRFLAPCEPSKIVAVGLNYRGHGDELNMEQPSEPVLFLKPPSAVIGPYENIVRPKLAKRVDYEAELAVVIGKKCKDIDASKIADYILGFTCFNDVTARDLQARDGQWTRAKSFDTFAPIGPWIETGTNGVGLEIQARVDGTVCQIANTRDMIVSPYELVSYISRMMTLLPGDVIATGTPKGVGEILAGQTVEIYIEGIGTLTNYCV